MFDLLFPAIFFLASILLVSEIAGIVRDVREYRRLTRRGRGE